MRSIIVIFIVVMVGFGAKADTIESPSKEVQVKVELSKGKPQWSIFFTGR